MHPDAPLFPDADVEELHAGREIEEDPARFARHPSSARFHEILDEHGVLHDRKQTDYGREQDPFYNIRASEGWGVPPWVGAMVRLNDKVLRLQAYVQRGSLANEGVEDSLRDIAVYSTIALVLFEESVRSA